MQKVNLRNRGNNVMQYFSLNTHQDLLLNSYLLLQKNTCYIVCSVLLLVSFCIDLYRVQNGTDPSYNRSSGNTE